jgi:hypothetical protein
MKYTINTLFISNYSNLESLDRFVSQLSSKNYLNSHIEYIMVYSTIKTGTNSYKLQFFSNYRINSVLEKLDRNSFTFEYYYWSRFHKFCGYYNDSNDVYIHNIPDTLVKYEQLMPPIFDELFNIKHELHII